MLQSSVIAKHKLGYFKLSITRIQAPKNSVLLILYTFLTIQKLKKTQLIKNGSKYTFYKIIIYVRCIYIITRILNHKQVDMEI